MPNPGDFYLQGTPIPSGSDPVTDTPGTIPGGYSNLNNGGWHTVQNVAGLDSIPAWLRHAGMAAIVVGQPQTIYVLANPPWAFNLGDWFVVNLSTTLLAYLNAGLVGTVTPPAINLQGTSRLTTAGNLVNILPTVEGQLAGVAFGDAPKLDVSAFYGQGTYDALNDRLRYNLRGENKNPPGAIYQATALDRSLFLSPGAVVTLPDPLTVQAGHRIRLYGTDPLTVNSGLTSFIDGSTSKTFTSDFAPLEFEFDGAVWYFAFWEYFGVYGNNPQVAANYQVLPTDRTIILTGYFAPFTVTLPDPGLVFLPIGQRFRFTDRDGGAGGNNITIDAAPTSFTTGPTYIINVNYGSFEAEWDGSSWMPNVLYP